MFSFAITVCNEHEELKRLLKQLSEFISPDDELVIQGDQGKVTNEVISVLHPYTRNPQFKYVEYPLNKDFGSFKTNLLKNCTKDWIFFIDADEFLANNLLDHLRDIVEANSTIDAFILPRVNTVDGITDEYVKKERWTINTDGWINFPDQQLRLVKNLPNLKWINKVHERLDGYASYTEFPYSVDGKQISAWAIYHPKTFTRQQQQNEFYKTISN